MVVHGIGASTTATETEESGEIRLVGSPPSETIDDEPTTVTKSRRGVKWEEGTIDNENLNRKKSKICCIFHPQRSFDEEDDCSCHSESNSDSDSDSDSDSNNEGDPDSKPNGLPKKQKKKSKENVPRSSSPNAYEKQPKYPHKHSVHRQQ